MRTDNIPVIIFESDKKICNAELGFGSIADMVRERSKNEGFHLNILVVGRRGSGTSSLVNCIFGCDVVEGTRGNQITTTRNTITENDHNLNLTVTTYHEEDSREVIKYIDEQYYSYFVNEFGYSKKFLDTRVHACLWLIPSDNIRTCEIELVQEISKKVNLIPIISKSDGLTEQEKNDNKARILNILRENNIDVYQPKVVQDDDIEYKNDVEKIIRAYPLSVFSGKEQLVVEGVHKIGRVYPWGFLDCEDENINDLPKLRRLLIQNHLEDLIHNTDVGFYNTFRKEVMLREGSDENIKKERLKKLIVEMTKINQEKHEAKLRVLENDLKNLENDSKERKNAEEIKSVSSCKFENRNN